jgi:hypothetical protein
LYEMKQNPEENHGRMVVSMTKWTDR